MKLQLILLISLENVTKETLSLLCRILTLEQIFDHALDMLARREDLRSEERHASPSLSTSQMKLYSLHFSWIRGTERGKKHLKRQYTDVRHRAANRKRGSGTPRLSYRTGLMLFVPGNISSEP